jgi:trimeric autotransporter adhesin
LNNSTSGGNNTAHGSFALDNITTGSYNSAVGFNAGPAVGDLSNTTAIGYQSVPTASNQVRIGNVSVTSIGGQVSWSTFSDGRFKRDIKEDVSGLDFINQLHPVSYVVDKKEVAKFLNIRDSVGGYAEIRNKPTRQTGFVAQEVEAVVKKNGYVFYGVDAPKNGNDHYSIRYAEFVVPLVKAVQELTTEIRDQRQKILDQERKIESLTNQLKGKNAYSIITSATSRAVLLQNNPNPFAADTEIKMMLPDEIQYAIMMIYNPDGKQMKTIPINDRGDVTIKIAGNEFSAGMYFYTLITDGVIVDTKRMILTR